MSASAPTFEAVFLEYQGKIVRYLEGMVGAAEAEELAQETFLKISRGLPEFRGQSSLATWIYRIATNTARDRLRSRSFQTAAKATSLAGEEEKDLLGLPDQDTWTGEAAPGAPEALARLQMNSCIRGVVDELPEDYRAVVLLSDFEGLKDREVADVLGLSLGAVKIRLHRARAKLRDALGEACTFHRDERNEFCCEPTPDHAVRLRDLRITK